MKAVADFSAAVSLNTVWSRLSICVLSSRRKVGCTKVLFSKMKDAAQVR